MQIAEEEVEAVGDTRATALVVGKHLAHKLRIWKRARKVKVRQEDGSVLGGNFIVNTSFKVMDSSFVLRKFTIDTEVLDVGNRDLIMELSWLTENGFSVDTQSICLRNVSTD